MAEADAAEAEDDTAMPEPAYRPEAAAAQPVHVEDDAGAFVAPRPRAAGTPSPEALARLQAAVSKVPGAQRAAEAAAAQRPAATASAADKPRFGINSLINRMTGHGPEDQRAERMPPVRQQPQMTHAYDDEPEHDPDQERIEIPAFLRRQAN